MAFSASSHKALVSYKEAVSPIEINGISIAFVSSAEHVGIVRSVDGKLPHIQNHISSHMKALFSVMPAGLGRNQNTNPAVSLRIQSVYANPVLLSGVAPLILSPAEISILHIHHSHCIQNLQKTKPV